jgi:hypothetical protein
VAEVRRAGTGTSETLGAIAVNEQPMPRQGRRVVLPWAVWFIARALWRQTRKGWRRYHSLLRTDNGRDVGRDWLAVGPAEVVVRQRGEEGR